MVVIGQSGCIPAKVVVLLKKRLYLGKGGIIRAKVVIFVQSGSVVSATLYYCGCIRTRWIYSGKVIVFGEKLLYSGKND